MLANNNQLQIGVLILILFGFAIDAMAGPVRYVHDYLIITMKERPSEDAKLIKTLPTGSKLEVLDEDGDFVRVRSEDGSKGWVRKQYLIDKPVARTQLAELEKEMTLLESTHRATSLKVNELKNENAALTKKVSRLDKTNNKLSKENETFKEIAARPIEIEKKNKIISAELEQAKSELEVLRKEHAALKVSAAQKWFLIGSAVLLLGVILGLLIPKLRYRNSSIWS